MPEQEPRSRPTTTVVLKTCGHYGLVREAYSQAVITCSQCELLEKPGPVRVLRSRVIEASPPPTLGYREMQGWLKHQLRRQA